MDANHALNELLRVSEEVRGAVVFELGGEPIASNLPEGEAQETAGFADAMLAYAQTLRPAAEVRQLGATTPEGDVYLVRQGGRAVVATAVPGSLPGLVQHDLRALLHSLPRERRGARAVAHA